MGGNFTVRRGRGRIDGRAASSILPLPARANPDERTPMPYVLRDQDGQIMAVFDRASVGRTEEISADDAELQSFLETLGSERMAQLSAFTRADLEFIRVLEDLIGALLEKSVISLNDLPAEARQKVLNRSALRATLLSHMPVLELDENETIFRE